MASRRSHEHYYYYLVLVPLLGYSVTFNFHTHFKFSEVDQFIVREPTIYNLHHHHHDEQPTILLLATHRGTSAIKIRQPSSTAYSINCIFAMPYNFGSYRFPEGLWNIW